MSGSLAVTSTIQRAAITSNGTKREKHRRKPVPRFENLLQAARSKSIELNALKAGLLVPPDAPVVREPARLTMNAAINEYLEYIQTPQPANL